MKQVENGSQKDNQAIQLRTTGQISLMKISIDIVCESMMKRKLLVLGLGIGFLLVITGLGTFITNYFPTHPTSQVQTTQAGTYTVILSINPNPPPTDKPTTLTVQIQQTASHSAVNGLQVAIDGAAQGDMGGEAGGSASTQAQAQNSGTYVAHVSLGMSGSWQIQVVISKPGQPTLNAVFTVTTQ